MNLYEVKCGVDSQSIFIAATNIKEAIKKTEDYLASEDVSHITVTSVALFNGIFIDKEVL